MSCVFELFCEKVGRIDDARDVKDNDGFVAHDFLDFVFLEIDMFEALGGEGSCPVDCSLIVVVDTSGVGGISDPNISGAVLDAEEFFDALVGRDDLCLA